MSSFDTNRALEIRGMVDIVPFIKSQAFEGRFVLTDKGMLSEFLQKEAGDLLFTCKGKSLWAVEVKSEATNKYGNFFLEVWSNRCFGRQTPGWMITLKADILLYYFLEQGELYSIPFKKLWEWFWGAAGDQEPAWFRYRHRPQKKHFQPNITVGVPVPITVVEKEVGFRKYRLTDSGFVDYAASMEQEPLLF